MMNALVKLYERLGFDGTNIIDDYNNDYLSENDTRDGREVLWYVDETHNEAIYVDTAEFLTEEEIEEQLA